MYMKSSAKHLLRKVPEITIFFWIVKLLTTAMGEATSDYLVLKFNPYLAVAFGGACLVIALVIQFWVSRYIAWVYWLAVAMVAVSGTMAADVLHIKFGIPYVITTTFFGLVLAVVFIVWYKSEKTLSIHSINTRKREIFYWLTVMATFALGTAAGDMTATTLGLGYFTSGLLFGGLILLPLIGYFVFDLNEIFAFWFAYILTRPLGASFADWMSKPKVTGGLGWGDGRVSLVLSVVIIMFVIYLSISRRDIKDPVTFRRH